LIISLFWKQRHDGGEIVPIYEAKKESKLQDFVLISYNPFDAGKTIEGIGNKNQKTEIKSKDRN